MASSGCERRKTGLRWMALVRRPSGCPSSFPCLGALHHLFFVLFFTLGRRAVRHGEQVVLHGQQRIGSVFELLPVDANDDFGVELVGFLAEFRELVPRAFSWKRPW